MSGTFWILVIIGLLIVGYCMKKGANQGLVQELNSVLTLVCAALIYRLASNLSATYSAGGMPSALTGVLLLIVVLCAYGVFHMIFGTIHIFSRLPVIRLVDNILGVFGGLMEGLIVLYLADALLRYFVMT